MLVLESGGSRDLEVLLEYREETEDYSAAAISLGTGSLHAGDLAAGQSYGFELVLPEEALPGYRSEHGELYWQLDVKSDELGRDTHERRRLEVSPRRESVDA